MLLTRCPQCGMQSDGTAEHACPADRTVPAPTRAGGSAPSGPQVLADRYVLVEKVGEGGGGEVYRAWDRSLGIQVALKMLHVEDEGLVKRLKREIRVTRDIDHPRVARVFDLVEAGGRTFFTMRWLDGASLSRAIKDRGPLARPALRRLALGLVDALAAAHRLGIVHRDVKPANVMVSADGDPVLVDFGIATDEGVSPPALVRRGEDITQDGHAPGTPAFMAPEQSRGERAGPSADLWALALTVAFAVQGRTGRPARPERTFADLGRDLAGLLSRCLDPDPARRPADAVVLREALARSAARRRVLLFAGALCVAIAAGAAGGLSFWRGDAPGAAAPSRIHVSGISDETGDAELAWVAPGVADLLRAGIESSGRLLLSLEPSRERDVARVTGTARSVDGQAVVELRLVVSGRTRATRRVAATQGALLTDVDAAVEVFARALGSRGAPGSTTRRRASEDSRPTSDFLALAHYERALGHLRKSAWTAALSALRAAIARDARFASAHLERVVIVNLRGVGSRAEAQASVRAARENAERLRPAERAVLGAIEENARAPGPAPFKKLRASLAAHPPDAAAYHMAAMISLGEGADRRAILADWAARIPDDPAAHNLLGWMHIAAGNPEGAEPEFREYLKLAPGDANAHDSYANLLRGLGRGAEALREYERALQIDPGFGSSGTGIVALAIDIDDLDAAEKRLGRFDPRGLSITQLDAWIESRAAIPVLRGDLAAALRALDDLERDDRIGSRAYLAHETEAILRACSGDVRGARTAAVDAERASLLHHGSGGAQPTLLPYVEALAAARRRDRPGLDRAARAIAQAGSGLEPFVDDGRRIFVEGISTASRGDPSAAAERLGAVATPQGRDGVAFLAALERARALRAAGRPDEADAAYRLAEERRGNNWRSPEVAFGWSACLREGAEVALGLGDADRARRLEARVAKLAPAR